MEMNTITRRIIYPSLFLLVLGFVGCGNPPQLRFGLLAPETGEKQNIGKEVTYGSLIFTDEVNSRPGFFSGFTVGLIHYNIDDQPSTALSYAKRLMDQDKVLGLITYLEDPTILSAVAAECTNRNVPLINLSGAGWKLPNRTFIELGADETTNWQQVVDVALQKNPNVPIAYINMNPKLTKHSEMLQRYLTVRGLTLIWQNISALEAPESIETAVDLRRLGIKLIFVDGSPFDVDPVAYQLALDRYHAVFVFLEPQDFPEKFLSLDLNLFPEALFYCRFTPLQTDLGARQFTSGYHARVGRDPNSFVTLGYDGMTLLAKAWQVTKQMDPASVQSNITSKSWQLATTVITSGTPQAEPKPLLLTVGRDELDKPLIMLLPEESKEGK